MESKKEIAYRKAATIVRVKVIIRAKVGVGSVGVCSQLVRETTGAASMEKA